MNILFISSNYPTKTCSSVGTFVQQFVWAMARQGHSCSVINPVKFFNRHHDSLPPRVLIECVGDDHTVTVYHPRYVSFSSRKLGFFNTGLLSNFMFNCASFREINRLRLRPSIVYGHFLYPAGFTAVCVGRELGIPSVVGVGEGEFWTLDAVGDERAIRQMKDASGFLAVSEFLSKALIERLGILPVRIGVFPNGVNLDIFRPCQDSLSIRTRLGIPSDTFNIGYIGPLTAKKGYPQLSEAVSGMKGIKLVVLGRGVASVDNRLIAFSGAVSHKEVPGYLATCDIFVLPTAIEGSCNAIIEAMACGLPIITSKGHYMDDIIDDDVAIRVDPNNIIEIREAIVALKQNPELRRRMSSACLQKAKKLDINLRAERVSAWMDDLQRKYRE